MAETNSNSLPPHPMTHENAILLKLPEFGTRDPRVWFAQVEIIFESRNISNQRTMYNHLVGNLPDFVASEVSDLIFQRPEKDPYDVLKSAILSRLSATDDENIRKLLAGQQLGDRTPSQLLRHMQSLSSTTAINERLLRERWLQNLPQNLRVTLAVIDKDTSLTKLAELADQVHQNYSPMHQPHSPAVVQTIEQSDLQQMREQLAQLTLQVSALTTRNPRQRSRSNSRGGFRQRSPSRQGVCYYHRRFGANARRCTRPCTFYPTQSSPGNLPAHQ